MAGKVPYWEQNKICKPSYSVHFTSNDSELKGKVSARKAFYGLKLEERRETADTIITNFHVGALKGVTYRREVCLAQWVQELLPHDCPPEHIPYRVPMDKRNLFGNKEIRTVGSNNPEDFALDMELIHTLGGKLINTGSGNELKSIDVDCLVILWNQTTVNSANSLKAKLIKMGFAHKFAELTVYKSGFGEQLLADPKSKMDDVLSKFRVTLEEDDVFSSAKPNNPDQTAKIFDCFLPQVDRNARQMNLMDIDNGDTSDDVFSTVAAPIIPQNSTDMQTVVSASTYDSDTDSNYSMDSLEASESVNSIMTGGKRQSATPNYFGTPNYCGTPNYFGTPNNKRARPDNETQSASNDMDILARAQALLQVELPQRAASVSATPETALIDIQVPKSLARMAALMGMVYVQDITEANGQLGGFYCFPGLHSRPQIKEYFRGMFFAQNDEQLASWVPNALKNMRETFFKCGLNPLFWETGNITSIIVRGINGTSQICGHLATQTERHAAEVVIFGELIDCANASQARPSSFMVSPIQLKCEKAHSNCCCSVVEAKEGLLCTKRVPTRNKEVALVLECVDPPTNGATLTTIGVTGENYKQDMTYTTVSHTVFQNRLYLRDTEVSKQQEPPRILCVDCCKRRGIVITTMKDGRPHPLFHETVTCHDYQCAQAKNSRLVVI